MKRNRSTSLRSLRAHGPGMLAVVLLAASGVFFEAKAETKKTPPAGKAPSTGKAKPELKPAKPPATDGLYEGPGVAEAPIKAAAPVAPPVVPGSPSAVIDLKPYAPRNADAWPSEYRPAPTDLLLNQQDENRAAAIAAYAEAEINAERGNADKALKSYKKAAALDPADARLAIKVARELLKTNDPTAAIQVIKDSIAASPKEPKTHLYLARIYADHLNKSDLARQSAEKALELSPDYFPAWKAVLDFSAADGQGKKTDELIERAMKSPSQDANFWLEFALFLRKNSGLENHKPPAEDEKKRIETAYKRALELNPKSAAALAQFGDYFALLRDHKRAITNFEQARALKQPANHPALENLGEKLATALVADGRKADALPLLERLVADFPDRNDLGMMLAEVYDQTGQTEKALAYYQRSLALDLTKPENHISLAETLVRHKHYDRAVATMQSAREKFPDRPEVTYSLARCLALAKKHQLALEMFATAQKEMKGRNEDLASDAFFFSYGAAAEQAGQFEKAAELLKKCIELKPDSPEAYNYLGYMWADRGERLEEAGALIKKAVDMEPENAAYLDSLGWWYFKSEKYEEAKKELNRAIELMAGEEDATVFDHLADTLDKLGKRDEALKLWKKALKLESEIQDKLTKKIADAEKK